MNKSEQFELEITNKQLFDLYSERAHGIFICWVLGAAFNTAHVKETGVEMDWLIKENVAVDLYKKYRQISPSPYVWSIAEDPSVRANHEYIERYGITCMYCPREINDMLDLGIAEENLSQPVEMADQDYWFLFQDLHLSTEDIFKLREHILKVISDNDPNGVYKLSARYW
jgi:hypothetical protein